MERDHQRIFKTCCQKRLQQYTESIDPDTTPQTIAQARYLAAYLDQWCLSLASKRFLSRDNLCFLSRLPSTDLLREVPDRPVWIAIDPTQTSYDPFVACAPDHVIAAAFFYALECPFVLQHACVPPVTQRSWRKSDPLTPAWWEWQFDFITTEGDVLSEYLFTYDARTGQWRKMAGSQCLWEQCHAIIDQNLSDDPTVCTCQNCQKIIDSASRWLALILNKNIGQELLLDTTDFEMWTAHTFNQFRSA